MFFDREERRPYCYGAYDCPGRQVCFRCGFSEECKFKSLSRRL
jgi:hypothetical protein